MKTPILRTGVDIVEIERFEKIRASIRSRFINRVYTEKEQQEARDRNHWYAGRFAAKEAVAKALGTGIGEVNWQHIEILTGEQGEPLLFLHQAAAKHAALCGLVTWSISISHSKTNAVAFVVAMGDAVPT